MEALPRHNSARSDYGEHEEAIVRYREEGTRRALAMKNRGPLTIDSNGNVSQEIVEGVLSDLELADLESDIVDMLDRAPSHRGSKVDRHGRPALGSQNEARAVSFAKPLADPVGGTDAAYGRHQAKMIELEPPKDAPKEIVQLFSGALQFSEAYLRLAIQVF